MATETVNGATLLARTLKQAGDQPIFTLSGHQILPIYDAGIDVGLRFIDTRTRTRPSTWRTVGVA